MPENDSLGPDSTGQDDPGLGPTQRQGDLDRGETQKNLSGAQTVRAAHAKRVEDLDSGPTNRANGVTPVCGSPGDLVENERQVGRRAGDRVFGRYILERVLGRGGMGIVWLAWDEKLEGNVALKFLPDALAYNEGALADLKRETKRAMELSHPHIVRMRDWVSDGEHAAACMEYVDGKTLSTLRALKPSGVFEVEEIREWVRQLCEALNYAHTQAGVVHRDLKPQNLLVNGKSELKVTDFGIARSLGEAMTRTTGSGGGVSGSPGYMSPQQWQGKRGQISDDIYSLGATIYELLTGKPPFYSGDIKGQTVEEAPPSMIERRRELEVESGEPIPEDWEAIVAACLAKEPGLRPASAKAVWDELARRMASHRGTKEPGAEGKQSLLTPAPTQECRRVRRAGGGRTLQTGETMRNALGMELVWIAPGKFTLGSPASESGRHEDEGPQTEVTLTKGFWLGKYQVTQAEYEAVMGSNPSHRKGPGLPVETVSWTDAVDFCRKLTERERSSGKLSEMYEYRLPTEAQWEYACRAGTRTRFSFGDADSQLGDYAWYDDNSGSQTHPVGQKQPNAWGLYDMHGNVWEWCSDWWSPHPGGRIADPTGASAGSIRVSRGGAWYYRAAYCRSASRGMNDRGHRLSHLGFRAALAPTPQQKE